MAGSVDKSKVHDTSAPTEVDPPLLATLRPDDMMVEPVGRLAVLADVPTGSLRVHEIYRSVQGESTYAGLPCTFIRLTGCPLRCRWCDTPHAFSQGEILTQDDVLKQVARLRCKLVELTGGEPLSQPESLKLLTKLADAGYQVLVETSGAVPIVDVDRRVTLVMALKCPGSGEESRNYWDNLNHLKPTDEIKFVVADRADFEWAVTVIRQNNLQKFPLLISPVFGEMDYQLLADWVAASGLPLRFQIQLHKHIWHPRARGV